MVKVRRKIPEKVRASLQQEVGSICPLCANDDVGHFQVHHIDEDPENYDEENLLMLCAICHSKITKGDISPSEAKGVKRTLLNYRRLTATQEPSQTNTFSGNVSQPIFGNNNTINNINSPKTKKNKYPPGCIGYNVLKGNYVSYLIHRYHEFKEWEIGKENMRYGLFPSRLKKRYKIGKQRTLYNLPEGRFEELVSYLRSRIDGTTLGKVLAAKGQSKNYQLFADYVESQSGKPYQGNRGDG